MQTFVPIFLGAVTDTLWAVPYLFAVYFILELIQRRTDRLRLKDGAFGPLIGSAAGLIPQCGVSAAAAELYNRRLIRGGTVAAVFLATSDDAIPLLLSRAQDWGTAGRLLLCKLIIGAAAGYALNATLYRRDKTAAVHETADLRFCACEQGSVLKHALVHTGKIAAFLLAALFLVEAAVDRLGEETFEAVLLTGSRFQPFVTALIGLIPGCSASVLITQLMIGGELSFGSAVAGLSASAGFGYVVLIRRGGVKRIAKLLAVMYAVSVTAGLVINFIV
jgi:hypothetical protein